MPVEFTLGHFSDNHHSDESDRIGTPFWGGENRNYSLALDRIDEAFDFFNTAPVPDLVILTGDNINGGNAKNQVTLTSETISRINTHAYTSAGGKILMIPGNWEYGAQEGDFGKDGSFTWQEWWD